ncbi:diguanylate cyclase (GGDEF)-like protein [Rhodobacteraceae bacterium MBR-64]|jgi:diguanylate cyclase (GGDEF)-like protein
MPKTRTSGPLAPAPLWPAPLWIDAQTLGRLMPMHVHIGPDGDIVAAGPTITRLLPPGDIVGRPFLRVFTLRRPRTVTGMDGFRSCLGQRLHLQLRKPPGTAFRGLALELPSLPDGAGGQGVFLNLSFGLTVAAAVRTHGLAESAFAPTDLTIEMLYLTEAKSAVMKELHNLNARLQDARDEAEGLALTDALTGLRNRRALQHAISQAIASNKPFGLMQLDLDHFKAVNDTLGHAAGDHVLCQVGKILIRETRGGDTVARIGGDEFVILFPDLADLGVLRQVASRVLAAIEQPIDYDGNSCRVSASIGLTMSHDMPMGQSAADLMLQAVDRALYASKDAGRGCITVHRATV